MAELKVLIEKLKIEEHPNADVLELAVIGGYRAIVPKGQFVTGDLAAYIPQQSIVPDWLITKMGLEGRLAGKQRNRVKAIKLRGAFSEGLVLPLVDESKELDLENLTLSNETEEIGVYEGFDVREFLGIEKYEPVIPTSMNGEIWNAMGQTIHYDIENWKNYPNILQHGEEVIFTEKLHGTWCCFGKYNGDYIVNSKGQSAKGLAFKLTEENKNNLYVRQFMEYGGRAIVDAIVNLELREDIFVLGEIIGKGIQDLGYGMSKPIFRIFDIYCGNPQGRGTSSGFYFSHDQIVNTINNIKGSVLVDMVPVLYHGPFSEEVMTEYMTGNETVSGKELNIREGIVMKPITERNSLEIGRVILKSLSEKYLLRKGNPTEYN